MEFSDYEINLYECLEVLDSIVYLAATSDCFDAIYTARGGIPFDDYPTFESCFYEATVKKTPAMYKGVKKTKTKHFTLEIPALEPDEEFEINMDDIRLGSIKIFQNLSSKAKIVGKEELDAKFSELKEILVPTPAQNNSTKKQQSQVVLFFKFFKKIWLWLIEHGNIL